jgi:pimeloyl-ACP methyl ester carboxylesterase
MRHVFLPLALAAFLLAAVLSPRAGAGSERASHSCIRGGELWFYAADGTKLVGHRFGKGTTAVILGHQSGGDLCEWLPYARRLASQGLFVFAIDFRGHGFSQFRGGRAENRLAADLAAATKTVRKLGKRKVFLVGASMGGIASLVAGANVKPALDGVVSISSPARYRGLEAVATAPRLRVPVLYLAAEDDDTSGYDFSEDARTMYAATASAEKRLEIVPGTLHGVGLVAGSARVKALIEGFVRAI